jgi:hypothetical protein
MYSDAGPSNLPFRCDDGQLVGINNPRSPNEFDVSWDPNALVLTWDGKIYRDRTSVV